MTSSIYGDNSSREIFVDYDFDNADGYRTAVFKIPVGMRDSFINNVDYRKLNKLSSYKYRDKGRITDHYYQDKSETIRNYTDLNTYNPLPLYSLTEYYEYLMETVLQYYKMSDIRFNGEQGMLSHIKTYLNGGL